jgi:hypothetical protein
MSLLDRATLAALSNRTDVLNTTTYPDAYLLPLLAATEAQIERYLRYRPSLSLHSNEEGPATYLGAGPYAGRYLIELVHRPLVPGAATAIFTTLQLTYALALTTPTDIPLDSVVVEHSTGRLFALAPGFVDALAGVGFQYATTPSLHGIGYIASYAAGWSAIGDPSAPGGGSYGADPVPKDIQYAAALLAQEALAVQAAQNANAAQPFAGILQSVRVGERSESYRPLQGSSLGSSGAGAALGFGSALAQQAASILGRYKKAPAPQFV